MMIVNKLMQFFPRYFYIVDRNSYKYAKIQCEVATMLDEYGSAT